MAKHRKLSRSKKHPPTKQQKRRHALYVKFHSRYLKYAKKYYKAHKSRILARAKKYRRLTKKKGPFYKQGKPGGRWPRFKRLKRTTHNKRKGSGRRRS